MSGHPQEPHQSRFPPLLSTKLPGVSVPSPVERKSPMALEGKIGSGRGLKEDRRGTAQERKQLGTREKEDKKGSKSSVKESRQELVRTAKDYGRLA